MKLKATLLIVLICFASAATTFVLGIPMKSLYNERPVNEDFQSNTLLCNGTIVEPNGPIDTPGGPT